MIGSIVFLFINKVSAQIPSGYYDGTAGLSGDSLKEVLHNIIKNHTTLSYAAVKEALKVTDQDTIDTTKVICFYTGWTYSKTEFGNGSEQWNREHVWSKSHGNFGNSAPAGTDLHHLRPADASVNSAKSNRDFDWGTTQYIDGSGPTQCYESPNAWEPRDAVKGDVARMIFYMATRYEGDSGEPDLEIVDYVNSAPNNDSLYGKLSTLLLWNDSDPVDNWERNRNDIIYYDYQNNRNPFIDHPEFIHLIWGDSIRPEPSNHVANFQVDTVTNSSITLSWNDNDGTIAADQFLLMANTTGTFIPPVDTIPQTNDTDMSDGNGRINILHNVETYTWANLDTNTIYYFTIYPYTNAGTNINYKTNGTIPTTFDTTTSDTSSGNQTLNLKLFISEIADPNDMYQARFVELYNAGETALDFDTSTWYLCRQANGNPTSWGDIPLKGVLMPDSTLTIAYNTSYFITSYGFAPDTSSGYITGNGNDGYFLFYNGNHQTGILIDAFGVVNQDGTGQTWDYTNAKAVRIYMDSVPSSIWNSDNWVIISSNTTDMTPNWHHKIITWTGAFSNDWKTTGNWQDGFLNAAYYPDAGAKIVITNQGYNPVVTENTTCGSILLQPGATITIDNNAVFTVKLPQ